MSTKSTDTHAGDRSKPAGKLRQCLAGSIDWLDQRTGLKAALGGFTARRVPGGVDWHHVLPSAIAFTFFVQAVTGFFLWVYYSPSAQTAWESVYYIQHEVVGGWLLRGVHHYAAQVLVALCGLYVVQLVICGMYRSPRECVYWVAVLLGLVSLGSCLTGDLLAWDQNSFASTQVRVRFLLLLPWIGDDLFKLAAGGPEFGHLTLTRFFALHVSLMAGGFLVLLLLRAWLVRRAASLEPDQPSPECLVCSCLTFLRNRLLPKGASAEAEVQKPDGPYWPDQLVRNAAAWLAVMVVVALLVGRHALWGDHTGQRPGDYLGVSLGAPADPDPANFYAAARPEWSFRGLYQLSNLFPGDPIPGLGISWKIVPIFVLSGLGVLVVLAVPFVGRLKHGYWINVSVLGVLLVGLVVLSAMSWAHDARDAEYQAALAEGLEQAERARQLAQAPEGIPPTGALSLLRTDPKTQGPKLCQKQCTICHNYGAPDGKAIAAEKPLAPELYGFASRPWLADFMDPNEIAGPRYFGNTRFAAGIMVRYVEGKFSKLPKAEQEAIIAALSAEAQLPSQQEQEQDAGQQSLIEQGRQLIVQRKCTRCHRFHEEGFLGSAPDLTGYGSQEWLMGIVIDPTHDWFYGQRNDRMPAYLETLEEPEKNRLTAGEVGLVADWLRGDWYEPPAPSAGEQAPQAERPKRKPPLLTVATWASRRAAPEPTPDTPQAKARALYVREHCAICHDCTGAPGGDIVAADPSAPDLGGFASRQWIAGLLDPEQIKTRKYFGNSAFRGGDMADFVVETFSDLDEDEKKEIDTLVVALSAEAQLPGQREVDQRDAERIEEGRALLNDWPSCTDCHRFHDSPGTGAPDLTGYGSREWIAAILSDPTHKRFYGRENDGMPSYHMFKDEPQKNLLTGQQVDLLADWIRGAGQTDDGQKGD